MTLSNVWRNLVVFSCAVVIAFKSIHQHRRATLFATENTPFQCGQMVYLRATQLVGIPIGPDDLKKIRTRRNGISLGELQSVFEQIGFDTQIGYSRKIALLPKLSICKLNNPDHFVFVKRINELSIEIYSELSRPIIVEQESLLKQFEFSGYFIELTPKHELLGSDTHTEGPFAHFESLYQDSGVLNYRDYSTSNIEFGFPLKNSGNQPLQIKRVTTSCDCTSYDIPKKEIAPDELATIWVRYKPQLGNSSGEFSQSIYVETNCKARPIFRLEISGAMSGRMSIIPVIADLGIVEIQNRQYLFVDFPPKLDPKRIKGMIKNPEELLHCDLQLRPSSVADYNQYFSERDSNFIPLLNPPRLAVFAIDVGCLKKVGHKRQTISFEVYDSQDELGPVSSSIRFKLGASQ